MKYSRVFCRLKIPCGNARLISTRSSLNPPHPNDTIMLTTANLMLPATFAFQSNPGMPFTTRFTLRTRSLVLASDPTLKRSVCEQDANFL